MHSYGPQRGVSYTLMMLGWYVQRARIGTLLNTARLKEKQANFKCDGCVINGELCCVLLSKYWIGNNIVCLYVLTTKYIVNIYSGHNRLKFGWSYSLNQIYCIWNIWPDIALWKILQCVFFFFFLIGILLAKRIKAKDQTFFFLLLFVTGNSTKCHFGTI